MNATTPKVAPPPHLTEASQRLFCRIVLDYGLKGDDPALTLLRLALEAADRADEARQRIAQDGVLLADRFGQLRPHPSVAIERDSRLAAARLLRELGLSPDETAHDNNRPPRPAAR